jgi:hypothetical protein
LKYLFLDIDGVLNSFNYLLSLDESDRDKTRKHIDPTAVNILNKICEEIDPYIVVSSSWRIIHTINEIQDILTSNGFKYKLMGFTPQLYFAGRQRGDEIKKYIRDNKISALDIVILDDDSDMRDLKNRLVKTSYYFGLEEQHIDMAIKLFRK